MAYKKLFLKIRYFERGLSKILKKLTLFFLLNQVPFNGHDYEKQKGSGTFKGCVCYIFTSWFLSPKESSCETKKNVFYFTSKALFILKKIIF